MYKPETVTTAVVKLHEKMEFYRAILNDCHISISKGNRKIGRVLNVSIAPVITCPKCNCHNYCYDIKAVLAYPDTMRARAKNTVIALYDMPRYFSEINAVMTHRRKNKYLRFHVGGEIVNAEYFARMVETARNHPDFIIWTYTKRYAIVNNWIRENGFLPENFHVMFSEWRGLKMNNPYNLPEFRVVFKGETAPDNVWICPGNCDICKAVMRGCIVGETSYADEH